MKTKKVSRAKASRKHSLTTESATVTLIGLVLIIIGLTASVVQDQNNWVALGIVLNILGVIVVSVGVGMSLSHYLAAGKKNGPKS